MVSINIQTFQKKKKRLQYYTTMKKNVSSLDLFWYVSIPFKSPEHGHWNSFEFTLLYEIGNIPKFQFNVCFIIWKCYYWINFRNSIEFDWIQINIWITKKEYIKPTLYCPINGIQQYARLFSLSVNLSKNILK